MAILARGDPERRNTRESLRLDPDGAVADLFADPKRAADAMTRLCIRNWRKAAAAAGEEFDDSLQADVVKFTRDAQYWSIDGQGILVVGDEYASRTFTRAEPADGAISSLPAGGGHAHYFSRLI